MVETILSGLQGAVIAATVDIVWLEYAVAAVEEDFYDLVVVAVSGKDERGDVWGE